ncbi:MAG: M12 family metallo-peptidase, partial [Lacipirellulaceae bacterium]
MATNRKRRQEDLQLRFEPLEERRLLAADATTADLSSSDQASVSFASDFLAWQQSQAPRTPALSSENVVGASYADLVLPTGLPESFAVEIEYAGETLTLELNKNSIFGENTKFLVDDGSGNLEQVDHGIDRSYLGTVAEDPRLAVSAWLGETGLHATIIRPNQPSITVEPYSASTTTGQHRISVEAEAPASYDNHDHNGDGIPDHAPEDHTDETGGGHPPGCTCSSCCGIAGDETEVSALTPSAAAGDGGPFSEGDPNVSATTLAPTRTIEIREFEVGVEIGSAALLNNYSGSTTQQKVDNAMSVAQGIPGNLDARFLRAAGIKHRLGTVIIRTGSDPFNVANGNDSAGLSAFRNYWNNNPQEVGNTHDLAVYHVRAAPSGLAYVNSVGGSFRYALSASNGPTSWADGTLAHEFGHSWNLGHVPSGTTHSADFYESRPRPNGNAAGAPADQDSRGISIMSGAGSRNIGRLSTGEANRVLDAKQNKLQFGDTVANEPEVAPFGWVDSVVANGSPVTIDVIANDHDANNDVLDAQLRDTVSFLGGTISLSQNTGPGGRNEIIYTPPASVSGDDFFHYTVVDSTGRTDWGAVYVRSTSITVDTSQTFYSYDPGTPSSPVFSSNDVQAVRITHETTGDITWSIGVLSEDRPNSGQNAYNRDFVRGFQDTTWSHKIASGIWRVTLNMSDPEFSFDNMFVDAEGERKVSDIDRPQGVN